MSTFDALESSRESSEPIEVYRFALGGQSYLYTSAEDEITAGSDTYSPIGIARGAITLAEDDRKKTLEIVVPSTNPFARRYIVTPPGQKATVTIIRLQREESPTFATQVVIYKGAVQSVQFPDSGETAKINVQKAESATSRLVPRYTFMALCNHVLYGPGCLVDPNNHDHTGEVSAVSGNTITVTGVNASGKDFTGGYCKPTAVSDFRLILAQSGDVLTLLLPFETSPLGTNVQAFEGCDHLVAGDCALKFDNVDRFGGHAFVPNKDIFRTGLD